MKKENQKLKLLYLQELFLKYTDVEHGITLQEITKYLEKRDIPVTRKTLYSDIELLREYGMEIEGVKKGNGYYYYLDEHLFETAELKLLVDAVQASKFITRKKSDELIKKLEEFCSVYDAGKLNRQVLVQDRIKTMNESIYYNVDFINIAITENKEISFEYYDWNLKKELELKNNGNKDNISPWALIWDNENYYLLAYDKGAGILKHYRVDKMRQINILDSSRQGKELFEKIDLARYTGKVFGMYGGELVNVTLEFHNSLIGVAIDRFGKDVMIIPAGDEHFRIHVDVELSNVFLSWIISLGDRVKIVGPDVAVEKMRELLDKVNGIYYYFS